MRIGINVSDDLLKQVREIRPEVNISQICREALKDHVESYERAITQVDSDAMDEHVLRLAESTSGSLIDPDWETYALEDARGWVEAVDDYLWERFTYEYDYLIKNGREGVSMVDIWSRGNSARGFMDRIYEHYDWLVEQHSDQFRSLYDGSNPQEKAKQLYARAWLGYVLEVRRRLERHRKDEYEKVKAEREKYRQSLSGVELPPQLL